MANVLVVYYSRTGHTGQLAHAIAGVAGWEIEAVADLRSRLGVGGYLRSGYEATFRRLAAIATTENDPALYDLVVIGTPIWNSSVSSPIRTWLEQHRQRLRNVAFFSTCGGRGARRVFDQMTGLAGRQPLATLDVTDRELERTDLASRVGRFVTALEHVLRRHEAPELHA